MSENIGVQPASGKSNIPEPEIVIKDPQILRAFRWDKTNIEFLKRVLKRYNFSTSVYGRLLVEFAGYPDPGAPGDKQDISPCSWLLSENDVILQDMRTGDINDCITSEAYSSGYKKIDGKSSPDDINTSK